MAIKKLELRQVGGIAGPVHLKTLTAGDLPRHVAEAVNRELSRAGFFTAAAHFPESQDVGADNNLAYVLTVDDDEQGYKALKIPDGAGSAEMKSLINYIRKM
jgi:hypothetical protein